MFIIIVTQSCLLISSLYLSGIVGQIKDNAYFTFSEKVVNRKKYLEGEMNNRWSNINNFVDDITAIRTDIVGDDLIISADQTLAFLQKSTPALISMMRSTMTTGCFIILNDDGQGGSHSGIYLRDYDPKLGNENNNDLYVIKGPSEIARTLQVPMDNEWSYSIKLDETNKDFYEKPYTQSKQGGDYHLFGYWSKPFLISKESLPAITYSVPLINSKGEPYGVIGVDILLDHLYSVLPFTELDTTAQLGYAIALKNELAKTLTPIVINSAKQSELFGDNTTIKFTKLDNKKNISILDNLNSKSTVLASNATLSLYQTNTPFRNEQWVLIGMTYENCLLSYVYQLNYIIAISFIASILIGTFVAFWVGSSFSKPISRITRKVQESDPNTAVLLPKTGLAEIDYLSSAIENLTSSVLSSALQMSQIISMVNFKIGAFEYRHDGDLVTGTPLLFEVLNLTPIEGTLTVSCSDFTNVTASAMLHPEPDEEDVYQLSIDPPKWIKFKHITNDAGTLGVAIDVTEEINEKRIMKFERDYDSLTNIYNRYAFHRLTKKLFESDDLGVAAFVMFDLDNLKYVNDTFGHDYGDMYIKTAADTIASFAKDNAIVARMSGDEFYAFFYGFVSKEQILYLIRHMYELLDSTVLSMPNGSDFKVRMSSGISWYGDDSTDCDTLIKFADFAMYEGKRTVKGELREFNREHYDNESFMLSGREELNRILDNQFIEFAFQPIVCAKTGELYGYESLMRPESDVLGSPLKLLQIATAQSKLWHIEKITFFKTLSTYQKYHELFNNCKIFINSIPNQLLKAEEYEELKHLYDPILPNMIVELIESERLDEKGVQRKFDFIQSCKATIALDDYGSGYNSEISLLSLSPQIVKVDSVITGGIETDTNRQAIVKKLINYASERETKVLAEGIETQSQMEFLIEMGVDFLQGYYIARPAFVPAKVEPLVLEQITNCNKKKKN